MLVFALLAWVILSVPAALILAAILGKLDQLDGGYLVEHTTQGRELRASRGRGQGRVAA